MDQELFYKEWNLPPEYGCEKYVIQEIHSILSSFGPDPQRMDDMKTAVAEACLNAIEHGSPHLKLPVLVSLRVSKNAFNFRVMDWGSEIPDLPEDMEVADKWKAQDPRGWGLFLIRRLSDGWEFGRVNGRVYVDFIFQR
jgi:serine/threonine-protein kinase RsbW